MHVEYDASVDAAYIYLRRIGRGEAKYTYTAQPEEIDVDMINLDFDKDARLIGIEILSARRQLPAEVLESAKRI
jgi:uncharacterized protein YuzE